MNNSIFYNKVSEIQEFIISEFSLHKRALVRMYVSRIRSKEMLLSFDIVITLIKQFQKQNPDLLWVKNYNQNKIIKYITPINVKRFLINNTSSHLK